MSEETGVDHLEREIADLEDRLRDARRRRDAAAGQQDGNPSFNNGMCIQTIERISSNESTTSLTARIPERIGDPGPIHSLLLLADSALPLGSFAYSSGLESYLQHDKNSQRSRHTPSVTTTAFDRFLRLSVAAVASTNLPYVLAAHRDPESVETLDNDLDASTPCMVAQRASTAQGRALLGVWERSFRRNYAVAGCTNAGTRPAAAARAIEEFSASLKSNIGSMDELGPKGHLAPLWGVVCLAMGVNVHQTCYVFMLNHAKAVLSAAVRASAMGPYQAQSALASSALRNMIVERLEQEWHTDVHNAGQAVPVIDLWVGRHELLYSRIFNS